MSRASKSFYGRSCGETSAQRTLPLTPGVRVDVVHCIIVCLLLRFSFVSVLHVQTAGVVDTLYEDYRLNPIFGMLTSF